MNSRAAKKWAVPLIILGSGILPVLLYWLLIGRVPSLGPDEAKKLLAAPGSNAVLVDVRTQREFNESHLEGAKNWPAGEIMALAAGGHPPPEYAGRKLLLICASGIRSAFAARRIREATDAQAFSVTGGLAQWNAVSAAPCPLGFCLFRTASGELKPAPSRPSPLLEQWAACITAFGVKPLYMLLSFALILWTWKLEAPDLAALRRGLAFFLAGESFCAMNYLFFSEDSYLIEYLHGFGMVVAFGFTSYAVMEGLDRRVLKYSDQAAQCAALPLCGACAKHTDVPCRLRRLFMLALAALCCLCFIPLLAGFHAVSYNTDILGTAYNYSHPVLFQIYEDRCCPGAALFFFGCALLFLVRDGKDIAPAKVMMSAGLGFFGFSFFRLTLFSVYRDNLAWFVAWEEFTELIYVAGTGLALWIFREKLFAEVRRDEDTA
ncbi:MAG TPA: rhodanese-like domain-containing protein [bacterium]|nr:rhodanese-like domain-containing protein [bacterium]